MERALVTKPTQPVHRGALYVNTGGMGSRCKECSSRIYCDFLYLANLSLLLHLARGVGDSIRAATRGWPGASERTPLSHCKKTLV